MRKVLPMMRHQPAGMVVDGSSLGGFIPLSLNALFNGTKYALESVSESMELGHAQVRLVLPDVIKNDFAAKSCLHLVRTSQGLRPHARKSADNFCRSASCRSFRFRAATLVTLYPLLPQVLLTIGLIVRKIFRA